MPVVPGTQQTGESSFVHSPQIGGDSLQIDGGSLLGIAGEIPGQDGLLMEMTHLLRNIPEDPEESRFSVGGDGLNFDASGFDRPSQKAVLLLGFSLNEPIPQNPLGVCVFGYKDSELLRPFPEEGGVDDDSCTRNRWFTMFRFVGVDLSLNPRSGASIFFGKFLEGGAVVEILFEECFAKSFGASL